MWIVRKRRKKDSKNFALNTGSKELRMRYIEKGLCVGLESSSCQLINVVEARKSAFCNHDSIIDLGKNHQSMARLEVES